MLLVVDFQARLMPAIHDGPAAVTNARRLLDIAALLGVPALATEQNAGGLGPTVPALAEGLAVLHKMTFDACRAPGFLDALPDGAEVVVVGCEAHVCVLQTVLGLLDDGLRAVVVTDAIGSRDPANAAAAVERMARHGAEVVTSEMVLFEWLGDAAHPRFREVQKLLR